MRSLHIARCGHQGKRTILHGADLLKRLDEIRFVQQLERQRPVGASANLGRSLDVLSLSRSVYLHSTAGFQYPELSDAAQF